MHDRLRELGFDEAAGNFQFTNVFGADNRGGIGGDPILINVQYGAENGERNVNIMTSVAQDGQGPNWMRLNLFNGPTNAPATPVPQERDTAMEAETVLHEYTHAMVQRVVGHGVGLPSDQQYLSLNEGWADFFALALLSQAGEGTNGNYAMNAFATWYYKRPSNDPDATVNRLTNNYYFGKTLYPFSIDGSKNPIQYKDIQWTNAAIYSGTPYNEIWKNPTPSLFMRMYQFWGTALWEARASLIFKHQFPAGNDRILRLVVDGMKIGPAKPTPIQARDAIILADRVSNGGDADQLWAAFAKRGMGWSAGYWLVDDFNQSGTFEPKIVEGYDTPPSGAGTVPGNKADFNFDSWSDVVFQNSSTRTMKVWYMQTNQMLQSVDVSEVPATGWSLAGSADVNRDGKADLLLQDVNGFVGYWQMNGISFVQGALFSPSHPGAGWRLAGSGRFNRQDIHDDLLYQFSDSTVATWLMNGATLQEARYFTPSSPGDTRWKLVGAGDFNHDAQTDLVFQFQGTSSPPWNDGDLAVWIMEETTAQSYPLVSPQNPGDAFWRVVATADFDRDGVTDLLFQYQNSSSPNYLNLVVWLLDQVAAGQVPLKQSLSLNPINPGSSWEARAPK